jgi:hypothetical protein
LTRRVDKVDRVDGVDKGNENKKGQSCLKQLWPFSYIKISYFLPLYFLVN